MELYAISPLDGRYHAITEPLSDFFSEGALIAMRFFIEIQYLKALLLEIPEGESVRPFIHELDTLSQSITEDEIRAIKEIERSTNHDLKAVEYFLKEKLLTTEHFSTFTSFVHFALTSEDINNLAYALMMKHAMGKVILPCLEKILDQMTECASKFADLPMLSRTHGQSATPTTLGKEFNVFYHRIFKIYEVFSRFEYQGKLNGATGNFNAHVIAYPRIDWIGFSERFMEALGLSPQPLTTQIEPHDFIAELSHAFVRLNVVLIDFSRDLWGYLSLGYFTQKTVSEEVGSSTMPHKVNPIDFENAEGNLGLANALFSHFAEKLPISRYQRDLSDSTVLRSVGSAFAYGFIAYQSLLKGLGKITPQKVRLFEDLEQHPEILAEAIQTVLRKHQREGAYEQLKALTRGKSITQAELSAFIDTLDLPASEVKRLRSLTPSTYLGLAPELARLKPMRED
jgi:adenylosuccinate lyase